MEFKPFYYQEKAINKILTVNRCALFLSMGFGKTVVTLTSIEKLIFDYFDVTKVLIIAPLKVAEDTWSRELNKWDHLKKIKLSLVLGNEKKRIEALNSKSNIFVVNTDNVEWITGYLKNDWCFDMVVIDELSNFKNSTTKRFKALKKSISKSYRVVGLTGTPSPNGFLDLWSQVYLLDFGERLEKTLTLYRNKYFLPDKRKGNIIFSYKMKHDSKNIIKDKISDICFNFDSKLSLPEKVIVNDIINFEDRKIYDALEKDFYFKFKENSELLVNSKSSLIAKLLQLTNGAVYTENGYEIIHDYKINELEKILNNNLKVLCFYQFKHDLDRILKRFNFGKILSSNNIDDWNNGKIKLLLTHPKSSAYGLNLQKGGNVVVWFGLTWNLELYEQGNARIYRQGQTEKVFIHHLICKDTIDERVLLSLEKKTSIQNDLLTFLKSKYER